MSKTKYPSPVVLVIFRSSVVNSSVLMSRQKVSVRVGGPVHWLGVISRVYGMQDAPEFISRQERQTGVERLDR